MIPGDVHPFDLIAQVAPLAQVGPTHPIHQINQINQTNQINQIDQIDQIDQIQLAFSPTGLAIINVAIGLMMFGVALDLRAADFTRALRAPKAPLIGLVAQFILLPAFTCALTLVLGLEPSIALGMILVAACPGGNLSNLMTWLAGGNTALSVTMTALSTLAAVVMTPLNLAFWGGLNPQTAPILAAVSLSPLDILVTVFGILGLPLAAGLIVGRLRPQLALRIRRPFKRATVILFVGVVLTALAANWRPFVDAVGLVAGVVALHNALALGVGYIAARLARLTAYDTRAVAIEVGIQNSALGLVLVFNFFGGLGGMAIITAWWGVWHVVSGLTLATWWGRRPVRAANPSPPTSQRVPG